MDVEAEEDFVARIIVVGGRVDNTGAADTYLTSAESLGVRANGTLESVWYAETPDLTYPRAFYALVTTQDRETNEYPHDPYEPPCGDKDGDGYIDCVCALDGVLADCDDSNPDVNPGEEELCGDGIDQDCDAGCAGGVDVPCEYTCTDDLDGDGFISVECGGLDCCDAGDEGGLGCAAETAADIHPGAVDPCSDGIDQNCDGIDPVCDCTDDKDGDGFISIECGGNDCCDSGASSSLGCTDETSAWVYPGAKEWCDNGVDEDCDGEDTPCILTKLSISTPQHVPPPTGDEPVFVIATLGQSAYDSDAINVGRVDFEACRLDEAGHLACGANWAPQGMNTEPSRATFGHDALLYSTYLYPFAAIKKETVNPITREYVTAAIGRFDLTPPSEVGVNNLILYGGESASSSFDRLRGYYKMARLMSYLYVIGGWGAEFRDIDGNLIESEGPTGTIERHDQ
ncbi:MAG: putative metal-binding motif-containing protein [Myxococcota bacterium]|nr:putative metal-binding motif-containing protein [Myxococcota bacterium]